MTYDIEIRDILEKEVLSSLLNTSSLFFTKKHALSAEHFSKIEHKLIYSAIAKSVDDFNKVSLSTVRESIVDVSNGELSTSEVVELMGSYKPLKGASFNKHCELLFEYGTCDELSLIVSDIAHSKKNNIESFEGAINKWKAQFNSLGANVDFSETLAENIDSTIASVLERLDNKEVVVGVSAGTYDVNEFTSGWTDPDLVILAGRPGMGKTAYAIHCCKENVFNNDPASFISYEMPSNQILERMAASMSKVDSKSIKQGRITEEESVRVVDALKSIKSYPLHLIDKPLSLSRLLSYIRYLKFKEGIKVVYIDYVQLIPNDLDKTNSEDIRIGGISRRLKLLAIELKMPIVLLSQLSRAVESRTGVKKPGLSDLRGSGSLEQDADIVGFFYRPSYYGTATKGYNNSQYLCQLIIAKGRAVGTDEFDMFYSMKYNFFEDWDNNHSIKTIKPLDDDDDDEIF